MLEIRGYGGRLTASESRNRGNSCLPEGRVTQPRFGLRLHWFSNAYGLQDARDSSGCCSHFPVMQSLNVPLPGGRVVAVTLDPSSDNVAIATTQSGGLFRTIDGGQTWQHVEGLVPNRLWDVQIDPDDRAADHFQHPAPEFQ